MKTGLSGIKGVIVAMIICSMTGIVFAQANLGVAAKPASSQAPAQTSPKKINVAVINLKSSSGVTAGEADLISDRLRGELFNTGKVNVMERDQMQEILKEQGFQQSGACSNEACMVEMGQLLGVENLVTGSLGKVGSMFLVNLRIIDVKTAKITKVVSKDVKGSIEDVVGELRPIAVELVGASGALAAHAVVEKKTEEKPVETEEPKPEPVAEPQKEPEKMEPVPDTRADKNKNRFGISLGTKLFFGGMKRLEYDETDTSYVYPIVYDTFDYSKFTLAKVTQSPVMNFFVQGNLKAGPFLTITIGGGFSRNQAEYTWDLEKETHETQIYAFPSLGINFVKRWFPLKVNAGLFFDLNFLNYSLTRAVRYDTFMPFTTDFTMDMFSVNVDFGARAGVEILAGKHVGFSFDFIYCYSAFTTLKESRDLYDDLGYYAGTKDIQYELKMPPVGLGLGINFYF
jgi:curli biogenesis system outer membrane secretion channel CsgG